MGRGTRKGRKMGRERKELIKGEWGKELGEGKNGRVKGKGVDGVEWR